MFLTRSERDSRAARDNDRAEPGMLVIFPTGVKHFFPGGTLEFAMVLAANSPAAEWLDNPATGIQYGERQYGRFTCTRVVKQASSNVGTSIPTAPKG